MMSKPRRISRGTARALCNAIGGDCGFDEDGVMADEMRAVIAAPTLGEAAKIMKEWDRPRFRARLARDLYVASLYNDDRGLLASRILEAHK